MQFLICKNPSFSASCVMLHSCRSNRPGYEKLRALSGAEVVCGVLTPRDSISAAPSERIILSEAKREDLHRGDPLLASIVRVSYKHLSVFRDVLTLI